MKQIMKKILIIEDDSFLSEMYSTKLIQEGFETEIAINGKQGMDKIKNIKPDLILLDIVLPKMDGFEILESVKKDSKLKKGYYWELMSIL